MFTREEKRMFTREKKSETESSEVETNDRDK